MRPRAVEPPSSGRPATRPVDLGWLFLLPGIVLVAAAVLIAAEDDLYAARFRRDEALAIERRHAERVERYEAYLEAVRRLDPTVVRSLVAGQLNARPTDLVEERVAGVPVYDPGQVFASLEPPEAEPAVRVRVDSVMARWATDDSSRVWLMASGALCVFVGLLPPVSRRGGVGAGSGAGGVAVEEQEPVGDAVDEAEGEPEVNEEFEEDDAEDDDEVDEADVVGEVGTEELPEAEEWVGQEEGDEGHGEPGDGEEDGTPVLDEVGEDESGFEEDEAEASGDEARV